MSAPIIAIDPGASGAIAWTDLEGCAHVEPMADGMTSQVSHIRSLSATLPNARAIVERVGGYVPGNSGPAAVKFARHCGHLDVILYMTGLSTTLVAPSVWMKSLGDLPREKSERKRAIRELMARRFPALDVTLRTADALGILVWAMQHQ